MHLVELSTLAEELAQARPRLDVVPAAVGLGCEMLRLGRIRRQLEPADVREGRVVRIAGIRHPVADGRIDGRVDDRLIEVDDERQLLRPSQPLGRIPLQS